MSDIVIRIENLGKKYIINHQRTSRYSTLRDRMTEMSQSFIRELTSRNKPKANPAHEEFWALKEVSLNIHQGDRVGIIGRNGAGKSTLLKLLSRITEPTTGKIKLKGRVASLLEVGTGFHPELTGRENIYLNGAVLGMTTIEIKQKFDEIVAFAEVEKFLDTPVKHYSSGMYVRLAFAVAAHLEPEILIVDEVLAVGDIQFQKKCLGKMQDVSQREGRTVLFVSHNIDAIQHLCSHGVILERGQLIAQDNTVNIVGKYLSSHAFQAGPKQWIDVSQSQRSGSGKARFMGVQYSSLNEAAGFQPYTNGGLEFLLMINSETEQSIKSLAVTIYSQTGIKLVNADTEALNQIIDLHKGRNQVRLKIAALHLNPDIYVLGLWMSRIADNSENAALDYAGGALSTQTADSAVEEALDYIESAFEIEVINLIAERRGVKYSSDDGIVVCQFDFAEVIQ